MISKEDIFSVNKTSRGDSPDQSAQNYAIMFVLHLKIAKEPLPHTVKIFESINVVFEDKG